MRIALLSIVALCTITFDFLGPCDGDARSCVFLHVNKEAAANEIIYGAWFAASRNQA